MGTIVINQTDCKQNVVLQSSLEGITGGYYDAEGTFHELSAGLDLSFIGDKSTSPSVRNFFYALAEGNYEHGEFTLEHTTTTEITLLEFSSFSETTPPHGILFIDKDFSQNNTGPDARSASLLWMDKAFLNAAEESDTYIKYGAFNVVTSNTVTNIQTQIPVSFVVMDGETDQFYAKWRIDGNALKIKFQYNDHASYTPFLKNRNYAWIAY